MIKNFDITFYCNSHKGKDPLHIQYNQKTLMCGSYFLSEEVKSNCLEKGHLLDNIGINVSSMNPILGDLTGLYWIWKNTNDEFVGSNQYRRFYNEAEITKCFSYQTDTIFVANYLSFYNNVWAQYISSHGEIGLNILKEASRLKKIPLTKDMINGLYSSKLLSPCNMFFGHRDLFNKVCKIFLEIIFELYNGTKYLLNFIQNDIHVGRFANEKRLLAFLGERILNILYNNAEYFFGKIKIQPVGIELKELVYANEKQVYAKFD